MGHMMTLFIAALAVPAVLSAGVTSASADAEGCVCVCPELTWGQKFVGFISLIGVLKVGAILLGVAALGYLFWDFVRLLLLLFGSVPMAVYEAVAYVGCVGLVIVGRCVQPSDALYFGLAGCLLMTGALALSVTVHNLQPTASQVSGTLFVTWAAVAVVYGDGVIGFIAVAALMATVGFSAAAFPLCYAFGFKDRDAVGRATGTAFGVLIPFTMLRMMGYRPPVIGVFEAGALWMGSFVGFLGLLIASTRWYDRRLHYVIMNVVTLVAGVAAVVVGAVWGIGPLRGIGGTFLVLWAIEKPYEIPFRHKHTFAWISLFVAVGIGLAVRWCEAHIELIRPYLLF